MPDNRRPASPKRPTASEARTETGSASGRGWMTVPEVCEELGISRDTFYDWRKKGTAPRCSRLPNGSLRVRRTEFEKFMNALEEPAR